MNKENPNSPQFELTRWLQIEEACAHFEQQLRAGHEPRIESFLKDYPEPFRSHLLMNLLRLEFEFRIGKDESCQIREYLERFPQDQSLIQAVRDEVDFERESHRMDQEFRADHGPTIERNLENQPGFRHRFNRWKELLALDQGNADVAAVVLEQEADDESNVTPAESDRSRYRVRGELARGGMGIIYRVRDTELNRTLAMKVVDVAPTASSDDSSSNILSRFLEEAQITAQLDHPGIVAVHELGIDEAARPFFTMKLVKGQEFSKIVEHVMDQRDGWNLSRAVAVMVKVCQTIAYAHSRKVLHRDLKPANIMVGRLGEVYVMDWGLAKIVGREDTHDIRLKTETHSGASELHTPRSGGGSNTADSPLITMDGAVVGTPAYMSPEQARGDLAAVDHQSDVYSIGAVLYHLMTGHPPYVERGTTISPRTVLARVLDGPPKAISHLNPSAAPELIAICDKAMLRNKERRYESSEELAEDLQAFLDHRVVRAYQTGAAAELKAWVIRNRLTATLTASFLAIFFVFFGWKILQDRKHAIDLREQLARQYLRTGQALCEQGKIDHGLHWFVRSWKTCPSREENLKSDIETNLKSWRQRCNRLLQVMKTEAVDLTQSQLGEGSVLAFSPDGKRIVTGGQFQNVVKVWSIESGTQIGVNMEHEGAVRAVYFDQSGREITTISEDKTIRRWTDQGDLSATIQLDDAPTAIAYGVSRSFVFIGAGDGAVTVYSAKLGQSVGPEMRHESKVTALDLSPNEQLLLVGYEDGTALLWSVDSRQKTAEPLIHQAPINSVAFSPTGRKVVTGNVDGTARIWSVETGMSIGSPMSHQGGINRVLFSPDGALVATASSDETSQLWSSKDGSPVTPPQKHMSAVLTLAFSADGLLLLTGSHGMSAKLWSVRTGMEVGIEIKHQGPVTEIAFNPKDRNMAVSSAGVLEIWSMEVLPLPVRKFTMEVTDWDSAESPRWYRRRASVWGLDFNHDGTAVVIGGLGSKSGIWSFNGELLHELSGPSCWDAAFSPDGQYCLLGYREIYVASLWASDGSWLKQLEHDEDVRSVTFNHDGTMVATGSFDEWARIWNVSTGDLICQFKHDHFVEDLVFSIDGSKLITACGDRKVRFWSIATGKQILEPIEHNDSVLALDVSSRESGELIATGGRDHTVRFWDANTGQPVGPILEHAHWVDDLAFSHDGKKVITVCNDGNAQLWSVETGEKLGPPFPHEYPLRVVVFHPSDDFVLTGGKGKEARLWQIPDIHSIHVDDFETMVQTLTGKRMDDNGVMIRLTHSQWNALRAK